MAKYMDIAKELKRQIYAGKYPAGEPLPNQKDLAAKFGTSRVTIQKVLDLLSSEGIVYTRQGSGTYVKNNLVTLSKFDATVDQYVGATAINAHGGHPLTSKILRFEFRLPNKSEQEKLNLGPADTIYDIIRLRLQDGEPRGIEHTKMPVSRIPGITEDILHKSIYNYIEHDLGQQIGAAYRIIRADIPDQYDLEYQDATDKTPILEVEQIVSFTDGTPFEYSRNRHRYDRGGIVVYHPEKPTL